MSFTVNVTHDLDRLTARLDAIQRKQIPFATAMALSDVANLAAVKIDAAMPQIFDKPTPFTQKALGSRNATKSNLTALVFVKDTQAKYLLHEEIGGTRTGAENPGKPSSALVLPSKISTNAYGNIPFGAIKRLFAQVVSADQGRELSKRQRLRRSGGKTNPGGYDATRSKRDSGYFYMANKGPWQGTPGGIFKRVPGHRLIRLISFGSSATYHPRFGFQKRVLVVAEASFKTAFRKRLRDAIATAK